MQPPVAPHDGAAAARVATSSAARTSGVRRSSRAASVVEPGGTSAPRVGVVQVFAVQ
ncbi:hypothetical protein ACVGOW_00135 [Pseudonocardia saturnea]